MRRAWPRWCAAVVFLAGASCVDAAKVTAFGCDDAGHCATGGPASDAGSCGAQSCAGCCDGNGCVGGTDATACGAGGQACTRCGAGQVCAGGACGQTRDDGVACGGDGECTSTHCASGVCCQSACTGACETCAASGSEGRCTARSSSATCGDYQCTGTSGACPTTCAGPSACAPGRACDSANGNGCVDVDECATPGACGPDATCTNTPGSFTCTCPPGFTGAGTVGAPATCNDVDECATAGLCGAHQTCNNTHGAYECSCAPGYFGATTTGGPATCGTVDQCAAAPCGPAATCQSSGATYTCTCLPGYTGATSTGAAPACLDTDECLTAGLCGPDALCTNTPGTFACSCKPGFVGTSTVGGPPVCTDVDECAAAGVCGANAHCTNTPPGSFTCACDTGFFGTTTVGAATSCAAVDHCATPGLCGAHAACTNTTTSFTCACDPGYGGAGTTGGPATCTDTDECLVPGVCGANAACTNTPGSFTCACNPGFSGTGTSGGPATCAPTLIELGVAQGSALNVVLTLTQAVPVGATVLLVVSSGSGSGSVTFTDTGLNAWQRVVSNAPCGQCGVSAVYVAHLTTALVAGNTISMHVSGNDISAFWAAVVPAFPYVDQVGTASGASTLTPSAATSLPVTDPDELVVGAVATDTSATLSLDGGAREVARFESGYAGGIIGYRVGTGLSGAQTFRAFSNKPQRFSGVVATFYGGAPSAPSALTLSQTPNSRTVTLGWTGGRGNNGATGCQAQVATKAGTWTSLGTVNCDATTVGLAMSLPTTANWYGGTWASTTLRLLRIADGTVLGTFPTPVTCVAKAASTIPTPNVDENCNSTWDDHTCALWSWVASSNYPAPTYTACNDATGLASSACVSTSEGVTRYTDDATVAIPPDQIWSSGTLGTACTGTYTGTQAWVCAGATCLYR